ncbi:hypothetical protein AB0F72_27755 [Actinoplanes sp. NPDC023936]|uniref:hypothetical protein n=1 Tax=Actinoplanes sp. NPDC023936 TaxID=3154910 RepID=UPI0033D0821B
MRPATRAAAAVAFVVAAAVVWAYTVRLEAVCCRADIGTGMADADAYWLRDVRWGAVVAVAGLLVVVVMGRRPSASRRWPMTAAATVCMTCAAAVAALEGPGDTGWAPAATRTAAVGLLLVAGFAGVAAVAPARIRRVPVVAGLAASSFVLLAVVDHFVALLAGALLAVGAVTILSRPRLGLRAAVAPMLWTLVGYPALSFVMTLATLDAGRPVTALAGDPAVSPADSDMLYTVTAVTVGLAFAAVDGLCRWIGAELRRRPRMPDRPAAVV